MITGDELADIFTDFEFSLNFDETADLMVA